MAATIAGSVSQQSSEERAQLRHKADSLKWIAFVILLLGIAITLLAAATATPGESPATAGILLFAPIPAGTLLWSVIYRRSKRYRALSAQDVLASDPRPHVVYLRSFRADDASSLGMAGKDLNYYWRVLHPIKAWGTILNIWDTRTEEEIMAEVLHQIGPVVAIGRPGEKLPQLGAARVYASDETWKQTIHELFKQAGLVVLLVGKTEGFFWEVEQSANTVDPTRLILLVPAWRRGYEDFCQRAGNHFPKGLPAYKSSWGRREFGANVLGKVAAMVHFKPDWTPVFVDFARVKWPWKYKLEMGGRRDLVNVYDWALQPVYQQLGIDWKPPRIGPAQLGVLLVKSMPILILIFALVIIAYGTSR